MKKAIPLSILFVTLVTTLACQTVYKLDEKKEVGITETAVENEVPESEIATEASSAPDIEPSATPPASKEASSPYEEGEKREANLIRIPAGEFIMGSDISEPYFWGAEAPKHAVYLDEFMIYDIEVTNAMYRQCDEVEACPKPVEIYSRIYEDYYSSSKFDNYPVIHVTYEGAQAYCQWAGGRLPTEAEWEKAARGTDGQMFPWGDDELRADHANFCDIGCPNIGSEVEDHLDDGYRDTAPAGSFPAGVSPYGVFDMSGNVLEWVADRFNAYYYENTPYENPKGPDSGSRRVIRGGSWYSGREGLRAAARASLKPEDNYDTLGFRCAVDSASSTTPVPTKTPTLSPLPESGVLLSLKETSKGDYIQVQTADDMYEIGPLEKGGHALGPNNKFLVYASNSGIVYAARIGNPKLTKLGDVKDFTIIVRGEAPKYKFEFYGDHPYTVQVHELIFLQKKTLSIPRFITTPNDP